ncbi:Fic family protein [Scytonema sp. NUACC21]
MEQTIRQLCQDSFLTHKQLEKLLGRSATTLRVNYLSTMVKTGQLELQYPDKPTHPEQAYRTKNNLLP